MNEIRIIQMTPEDLENAVYRAVERLRGDITTSAKKAAETPPEYVTKKEAARLLSCSVSTIDNYRRDGKIQKYNVGKGSGGVRFKRSEILELAKK